MPDLNHLNRQFIHWFKCTVPSELTSAYERHINGAECEDRFFDSPQHALIHTDARGLQLMGAFRLGQSSVAEFLFTPMNGKVIVRQIADSSVILKTFNGVHDFLIWMLNLDEHGLE